MQALLAEIVYGILGFMKNPVELLRKRQGDRSLREFAKEIPCSVAYLSDVMLGKRGAGPRILTYLGMKAERRVSYRCVT